MTCACKQVALAGGKLTVLQVHINSSVLYT